MQVTPKPQYDYVEVGKRGQPKFTTGRHAPSLRRKLKVLGEILFLQICWFFGVRNLSHAPRNDCDVATVHYRQS